MRDPVGATENAEARAARTRGEERSVGCSHSCAAGGVAEEKVASLLFVGSIYHVPYRSNQPPTRLPACPLAGCRYRLPVQQTVACGTGRFSWVFAADA